MELFTYVMSYITKLKFVQGYRTYTAAAAAFGYGVYMCFGDAPDYHKSFEAFVAALGMLGLRAKNDPPPPNTTNPVIGK